LTLVACYARTGSPKFDKAAVRWLARLGEERDATLRDIRLAANALERRIHVRQQWTRGEMTTPKSRSSRRTIGFGPAVAAALGEQWRLSRYRGDRDLVFGHPALGTPLDPSKITRVYIRPR
jgi:hypothetical protein